MASVPNTIKEALLQINLGRAALILDLLAHLGFFTGDRFTFESLCDAVEIEYIDCNPSLIRRGLAELVNNGLISWRPIASEGRGRPNREYQLGSYFAMAWKLGIELKEMENCDSPTEKGFSSLAAYRKGLFYSFIKARPGKYSRRFLGGRLNVGGRTTRNYQKGTDIKVIFSFEEEELNTFDIKATPKTKQSGKFFIVSWDIEFKERKVLPYTEFIVQRELSASRRVFKTWQATNEYKVA